MKSRFRTVAALKGAVRTASAGTPQGGVISPLLSNVYLNELDRIWTSTCGHLGQLVRYADDFVILCRSAAQGQTALAQARQILQELRLKLHPATTRLVELGLGKEGFDFLGCHLRIVRSHFKRRNYLFRWPSRRAMNTVMQLISVPHWFLVIATAPLAGVAAIRIRREFSVAEKNHA